MNYSSNPYMVRGDLFTFSGKWKHTVTLNMENLFGTTFVHEAVRVVWERGCPEVVKEATGYHLVVLEPYHNNAYPVMIEI